MLEIVTKDEKDAWQFFAKICEIEEATTLYLEGKTTERRVMIILLDCLLKMDDICKSTVERLAREKRTQIEKKSQQTVQRLLRKKRG